ncbi:DUF4326 domain-containing protein [Streptomyces europaeiscabiei]|uniref:DUF4326 domain-containing protein n=1 Tax=Streptomyces europaeiscabiei TaxID=146819 RepID=UPI00299FD15C|nr:DUF4326 domain-containing protein [Streptomyces europaeiscabiei]MDX3637786.1 DUF4326 domain-containing protein [Streptomyces europaeiscabiei]MDX3655598.1 DUF4326 domain-containing protein [Streptomyces europaeiscabiei]
MTTKPVRLQRRRVKGWRKPEGVVIVDRTSQWGNPFTVGTDADDRAHAAALYREWLENNSYEVHPPNSTPEHRQAMDRLRDWIITHAVALRGRDLVCWCPLPEPGQPDHCHAAVLLKLANQPTT